MERRCCYCGQLEDLNNNGQGFFVRDLRPYGPGGALTCLSCVMSDPEKDAEAKRQMDKVFEAMEKRGEMPLFTQQGPVGVKVGVG